MQDLKKKVKKVIIQEQNITTILMTTTSELKVIMGCSDWKIRTVSNLLKIPLRGGKYQFTQLEVENIKKYKPKLFKDKFHKRKINIIDYYLSHQDNTEQQIAEQMGLKLSIVTTTLNEWLENKEIIVESKINLK